LPASKNKDNVLDEYVGKEVIMDIRPEDVHDEPRYMEEFADCKFSANVDVAELMGAETYLYLSTEGYNITARVEPTSTARPGDQIEAVIENTKIHLFDKDTEQTICN